MRLTIVGCSGSYPGPESPASCYLLEVDDAEGRTWRVVLDLGNGALGHLHRFTDPLTLDAVLISHHHPDHCGDINGYYVMRKYHPFREVGRVPVWGPDRTSVRMSESYGLPDGDGMEGAFEFRVFPSEPFTIGPMEIVAVRVDHPVEAYGLRVTAGGVTLGYSGDTAPCPGLDHVADGVDLLLAEASFREVDSNPPGVHLTGRDAGEAATRGRAKQLVITHVPPWFEREEMLAEAREVYDGSSACAAVGDVYDI